MNHSSSANRSPRTLQTHSLQSRSLQTAIQQAGLSLDPQQIQSLAETEATCLQAQHRIAFGPSSAAALIQSFGSSPYLTGIHLEETLTDLIESFYSLREDHPAAVTDTDIIEQLQLAFDGEAAGDPSLAASLAQKRLTATESLNPYEIVDEDGYVYRFNPLQHEDDAGFPETSSSWVNSPYSGHPEAASLGIDAFGPGLEETLSTWRDDITASGWNGEKWEKDYE